MENILIAKAKMGDDAAFSGLVKMYDRRVYHTAYSYLRNMDEAKDVSQEVFLRLHRGLEGYDTSRPFFPWLYQITKNLCLNRLGSRSYLTESLPEEEPVTALRGPEEETLRNEEAREIRSAVSGLPEKLREVIELKHFQGCSYKEMAEILDVPEGTVMSRLYNARKALRIRLS